MFLLGKANAKIFITFLLHCYIHLHTYTEMHGHFGRLLLGLHYQLHPIHGAGGSVFMSFLFWVRDMVTTRKSVSNKKGGACPRKKRHTSGYYRVLRVYIEETGRRGTGRGRHPASTAIHCQVGETGSIAIYIRYCT